MKIALYKNAHGKVCTLDFDPDYDGYDVLEEAVREMMELEAMDDYLCGYDDFEDPLDARDDDAEFIDPLRKDYWYDPYEYDDYYYPWDEYEL